MRRVWVVDDDEEMAHAIGLMLKVLDCEVILFASARSAAQTLEKVLSDGRYAAAARNAAQAVAADQV